MVKLSVIYPQQSRGMGDELKFSEERVILLWWILWDDHNLKELFIHVTTPGVSLKFIPQSETMELFHRKAPKKEFRVIFLSSI